MPKTKLNAKRNPAAGPGYWFTRRFMAPGSALAIDLGDGRVIRIDFGAFRPDRTKIAVRGPDGTKCFSVPLDVNEDVAVQRVIERNRCEAQCSEMVKVHPETRAWINSVGELQQMGFLLQAGAILDRVCELCKASPEKLFELGILTPTSNQKPEATAGTKDSGTV